MGGLAMWKLTKLAFVFGLCVFGWVADGSYKGAIAWLLVVGFFWFLFAVINASWEGQYEAQGQATARAFREEFQTAEDFTEDPQGPSRRGERVNPDPTRPTLDDYAGLITTYIERKRG